jgi:hypothetical protein
VRHPCFDSSTEGENAFSTPMKANTQHGEATEHVAYFANRKQPRFIEPRRCELPISSSTHSCPNVATRGKHCFQDQRPTTTEAKGAPIMDRRATRSVDTVIAWQRNGFRLYWRCKSRAGKSGRPCVSRERELIKQISIANPLWGAPRIHGELLKLGIQISQATVASTWCGNESRHHKPGAPFLRTTSSSWFQEIFWWCQR